MWMTLWINIIMHKHTRISRSVRITHAGSLGVGLGLGLGGAGGAGGCCGGRGVKGCISHDILYLLIICQMSKCQTPWLWRRFEKKRTWHNEAQTLWGQIWPHMWTSPKHLKNIFYEHFGVFWWSSNLTSKLTSSYLSLIMSSFFFLLTSSIDQVFDILTFDK